MILGIYHVLLDKLESFDFCVKNIAVIFWEYYSERLLVLEASRLKVLISKTNYTFTIGGLSVIEVYNLKLQASCLLNVHEFVTS